MTTLGAVFLPSLPPSRLRSLAVAAEESGLDELWLWEDCFKESGVAAASAVLAWTSRLAVGIGLLPVPLRNVALTAMEVATLEGLFPGRTRLAVGHGVQEWMAQVGARVDSPLTLLREHIVALRKLLAGEKVTTTGRYVHLDRVRLDWPPASAPAVLAGGVGPATLRLTGEVAQGTVLTSGTSPDGVRRAKVLIEEGRVAAGRTGPHPVTVYLLAATGPGAVQRMVAERLRWGFDPDDDVSLCGDASEVAEGVARWVEAGAQTVVLQPTADEPDPEGFVSFVGERVAPLVQR